MIKESLNFVCTQETLTVLSILPLLSRKKLSIQFKTLLSAIVSLSNIYYIHNQFGPSPKKKKKSRSNEILILQIFSLIILQNGQFSLYI